MHHHVALFVRGAVVGRNNHNQIENRYYGGDVSTILPRGPVRMENLHINQTHISRLTRALRLRRVVRRTVTNHPIIGWNLGTLQTFPDHSFISKCEHSPRSDGSLAIEHLGRPDSERFATK